MVFLFYTPANLFSQTNLIRNGQFDIFDGSHLTPPKNWSDYDGVPVFTDFNGTNPWEVIMYWNGDWNNNVYSKQLPNRGTPDIFKSKANAGNSLEVKIYPCCGPNGNFAGKQKPSEMSINNCYSPNSITDGYAGIGYVFSYDANNNLKENSIGNNYQYAEYLMQKLDNPLSENHIYKFSFKISKGKDDVGGFSANRISIALKYFGALFSTEQIYEPNVKPINYTEWTGIKVLNTTVLDKEGSYNNGYYNHWMTVEGYFIACDDYQYVYIGHFNNDIRLEIDNYLCDTDTSYGCYYFIDDVKLMDITNTLTCPNDSTPNCNISCDYNLIVENGTEDTACGSNNCKLFIYIQKDSNSCNYDIDFVRLLFLKNSDVYKSELLQLSEDQKTAWNSGGKVLIYKYFYPETERNSNITIKTDLFKRGEINENGDVVCITNPGKWMGEESQNVYLDCFCNCDSMLNKIFFEKDSNDCCYNLRIFNDEYCYLAIEKITFNIKRMNADGTELVINDNDFFNNLITYENGWSQSNPFVAGTDYIINKAIPHFIAPGENVNVAKICFPDDGNVYEIAFRIIYNDYECQHLKFTVQCLPVGNDCCDSINAYIEVAPVYEDGSVCCYKLHIDIPDSCLSDSIASVSVVSVLENDELFKSYTAIPSGHSTYEFCVDKSDFLGRSSIPVHIKFQLAGDSSYFCVKTDSIYACNSLEVPCTPDYSDTEWEGPNDGLVWIQCPSTGEFCLVEYRYVYRHVKDQNGNSLHRDIQIISFNYLTKCDCYDEIVKNMLEQIWNNQDVKSNFGLYGISPWDIGDTLCFTNFRVITSDCWMTYTVLIGFDENLIPIFKTYKKLCDGIECCYARYRVCYVKESPSKINYVSFEKLDGYDPGPLQCELIQSNPPCLGSNCTIMLPHGSSPQQIINTDVKINNNNCKVFVTTNKSNTINYLNIECIENGTVQLEIIDLMGNVIMKDVFNKKSFSIKRALNTNLSSGIFLLRITINNSLLFHNKINIIK